MSEQNAVQRIVEQPPANTMLAVIERAARDQSIDVSKLERLLVLAETIHAREAKAAYDASMSAAQGEMRPISRDCNNPQTRSRYASYEAIDTAIRPIYTAHGFAMSFGSKSGSSDRVIVTCRISHRAGHCEHVELEMPADGKGAKGHDVMTKTHATGSALSYAKRYISNLVWNLSFGEADDDGNAASNGYQQHSEPERRPQESHSRGFKPTNVSTPPSNGAGHTPQQMLAKALEAHGLTFEAFDWWAELSGQKPEGTSWKSFDDVDTPTAVRLFRAKDVIKDQIAKAAQSTPQNT
jgi:hypothetical protein